MLWVMKTVAIPLSLRPLITSRTRPLEDLGRQDVDRATLVVRALDVPLALEVREVLVNRGQRVIVELPSNLVEAGRVPVFLAVRLQKREDLALTLGQGHGLLSVRGQVSRGRPEELPKLTIAE